MTLTDYTDPCEFAEIATPAPIAQAVVSLIRQRGELAAPDPADRAAVQPMLAELAADT